MYVLYSLLLTIAFVLLLPRFALDALRHGKYVAGFRERLGSLAHLPQLAAPVVWLHCVSVGETQAVLPLVQALKEKYPQLSLVVTTTTLTGQKLARSLFQQQAAAVFYFPFDWAWTTRRVLRRIKPSLVLVMETELWPRFLRECRQSNIPALLVNGRLSEKSVRGYRRIRGFMQSVVNCLEKAVMQTEGDAARIVSLGLPPERITVSGNIKFDMPPATPENESTETLRARFNLTPAEPLIIAASTHANEEKIILNAYRKLRADFPHLRLMLVPRHPERFDEVAELITASGYSLARRSALSQTNDRESEIILLDSIGELRAVYSLGAVVFVGGSLTKIGGHNILEPAQASVAVITGAYTHNFAAIIKAFLAADAVVQLPATEDSERAVIELANALERLLNDEPARALLTRNARRVLEENRGATERTLQHIAPYLERFSR